MENFGIRREQERDYRRVEELHREAFWNVYVPGCYEHYLAHVLRQHEDFLPELDYVWEQEGRIIANIMYTKARLADQKGQETEILTFGPLGVAPEFQRRGIGKALMAKSLEAAAKLGYPAVVIMGNPGNYVSSGFRSCRKYNVSLEGEIYPAAMLVRELKPGFFDGRAYCYFESSAYAIDEESAEAFDQSFPPKEKAFRPSQEEFYILSHSVVR